MDTKYDSLLETITPPLFMLPWIGEHYDKTHVLFICESDYDDGVKFHKHWKREWIMKERVHGILKDAKLLNNIDKTILGDAISSETQRNLWNSVAYTNLVQRPMDGNKDQKEKPSDDDLFNGWQTILQVILELKPKIIIKWGMLGDGILRGNIFNGKYIGWKYDNIQNDRFLLLQHQSGFNTRVLFINHPSKIGYSTEESNKTIFFSYPELKSLYSLQ